MIKDIDRCVWMAWERRTDFYSPERHPGKASKILRRFKKNIDRIEKEMEVKK